MILKCFTKDTHGKVIVGILGGYKNILILAQLDKVIE